LKEPTLAQSQCPTVEDDLLVARGFVIVFRRSGYLLPEDVRDQSVGTFDSVALNCLDRKKGLGNQEAVGDKRGSANELAQSTASVINPV